MKPRRHVRVAPLCTPAIRELLTQSPERTIAVADFGNVAHTRPSKRRDQRVAKVGEWQMEMGSTRSRSNPSSRNSAVRSPHQDRNFEFTLSPKWSSWHTAENAGELFAIIRDLLSNLAQAGGLQAIHPAFQKVLAHRENHFLEVPMMEFLSRGSSSKKTARTLALYFEACYKCGDGSSRWLGWNTFSRPDEQRLYCIARDITESRSAAELAHKMHRMFHVSGDLFCVLDSRGHIQMANPAFEKLLGQPPQGLSTREFANLVHIGDRQKAVDSLGATANQTSVFFVARCACHPSGHKRVAWRAAAVPTENSIYCVGREVTGLRVVGRTPVNARQALVNVADLSNDINNPLEALVNLLFLLRDRELPRQEHGRYIEMAEQQVFRIATTLRQLR